VKLLENGFAAVQGNAIESFPVQGADSVLVVRFATEIKTAYEQRRNWARRYQGDGHALIVGVQAGDPRYSRDQHMSLVGKRGFTKNHFISAVM